MDTRIIRRSVDQLFDGSQIKKLSYLIHFRENSAVRYNDELTSNEGIYAFWLDNSKRIANTLYRKVSISGPSNNLESIEWNWNLDIDRILLYVGKSTDLKKRVSLHLKLGTTEWKNSTDNRLNKITTSCQMRAGIEHLIRNTNYDSFEFLNQFIGLSFVMLPDFKDRFFAEDLAIGEGKPWFNLDSER